MNTLALVPLLLAAIMLTGLGMAVAMALALPAVRHLRLWALACLLIATGFLLIALRGKFPDFATILLANLAFIAGYGATWATALHLRGKPLRRRGMLVLAAALLFALAYGLGAALPARVMLISGVIALFSHLTAHELWRVRSDLAPIATRLGAAIMELNAVAALLRLTVALGVGPLSDDLRLLLIGPIYFGTGVFVTISMQGIMALLTSESLHFDLRQRLKELEHSRGLLAQTLSAQQNATAMVSHEFNSALNRIASSVEILSAPHGDDVLPAELALIRQSVTRMSNHVEDILGAASLEEIITAPDCRRLTARDIAHENARLFQIRCHVPTEGADVFLADPILVEIALSNIIDNAIKYGGNRDAVELRLTLGVDHACFTVQDGGAGIPADDRQRVLERYYRGTNTRQQGGTGLGLYFSNRIAEVHGGDIIISADPSRVCLRFPLDQKRHPDAVQ